MNGTAASLPCPSGAPVARLPTGIENGRMARNLRYQGQFKVGDRVAIVEGLTRKHKVPADIPLAPGRPRTIVEVVYDPEFQSNLYILGSNGRGSCTGETPSEGYRRYAFRSYQLRPWRTTGVVGRPKRATPPEPAKRRTGTTSGRHKTLGG